MLRPNLRVVGIFGWVAFAMLGIFVGEALAIPNETCVSGACSACPSSCLQATCGSGGNCILISGSPPVRNCCLTSAFSSCAVTGCAGTYKCGGVDGITCSCNPPSGTC